MIRTTFLELFCDDCEREQTVVCIENDESRAYVCGSCLGTNVTDNRGTRGEGCYRPDTVEFAVGVYACCACGWSEYD